MKIVSRTVFEVRKRWQGPPHINKVKQCELSFKVSLCFSDSLFTLFRVSLLMTDSSPKLYRAPLKKKKKTVT